MVLMTPNLGKWSIVGVIIIFIIQIHFKKADKWWSQHHYECVEFVFLCMQQFLSRKFKKIGKLCYLFLHKSISGTWLTYIVF